MGVEARWSEKMVVATVVVLVLTTPIYSQHTSSGRNLSSTTLRNHPSTSAQRSWWDGRNARPHTRPHATSHASSPNQEAWVRDETRPETAHTRTHDLARAHASSHGSPHASKPNQEAWVMETTHTRPVQNQEAWNRQETRTETAHTRQAQKHTNPRLHDSHTPRHHTSPHRRRDHHYLPRTNIRAPFRTPTRSRLPVSTSLHSRQHHTSHQNSIPDQHQGKRWQKQHYRPSTSSTRRRRPNIVLIMTDDQDVELGSLNYMPYLMGQLRDQGAYFPNAYCSTPICCPSRSSLLTGLYIHNHEVYTNNFNCSSYRWQQTHEQRTFAPYLANAGYRTGYFGKYLNKYNGSHIPAGWHEWAGLIKNSRYYNYTVMRNGNFVKYGDKYPMDYFPHVITKEGLQFLRKSRGSNQPMMLVLSYPAPHGPEDSAPEHSHLFFNATDHNTLSYNYAPNPDKQWLLQFTGRMQDIEIKFTDVLMTKRLQTLQTVDEAVAKVVSTLRDLGQLDNTYIFYTSDHGYHLGQFGLVKGKSMPFEFDIKVPFLVRGPGIKPGAQVNNIALNIDLAPTFLDIAGVKPPAHMDGRSLLPILTRTWNDSQQAVRWRDSFLVESSGRHREEDALELREARRRHRAQGLSGPVIKGGLYTSKRERLEIICQSEEYKSPCKPGQKWECVLDKNRWRLHKCRRRKARGQKVKFRRRNCVCEPDLGMGYLVRLDSTERRKQRTFLKKHLTQDLRTHNTKFIKVFTDVDSQELMDDSLQETARQVLLPRTHHTSTRHRRSTGEEDAVREHIQEDMVDVFVKDEEIRDLDVTINTLSDELETLESNIAATSVTATNSSVNPPEGEEGARHGCHVTGSTVGCTDDVYRDPQAWRISKVAIDQQIRRLRHQLIVMKDIRKHLRDSRPDSITDYEDYDDSEDYTGFTDDLDTATTEGGTEDTTPIPEVVSAGDDGDDATVFEEIEDDGVVVYGTDYTAGESKEEENEPEEETSARRGLGESGSVWGLGTTHPLSGTTRFEVFPFQPLTGRRPTSVTLENDTLGRPQCWCHRNFRLEQKQVERDRKRQERQKLRKERQWIKLKRREKKEKKKMRKIKNSLAQCNYTMLNCYTHDNDHWKTPPLWHDGKFCFCMNAVNNTYWCVRTINQTHNFLYCEFITGLVTYYDLNIDPYQLRNVAFTLSNKRLADLHRRLEALRTCAGAVHCDDMTQQQQTQEVRGLSVPEVEFDSGRGHTEVEVEPGDNRVEVEEASHRKSKEKEERRRQREERQKHREERRRQRKEQKKLKRHQQVQLHGLRGRRVLQSTGSDRHIIRLPRKSRLHGRKRDQRRQREKRKDRNRRKKNRKVTSRMSS